MNLFGNLDENIAWLENTFADCGDIVKRKFPIGRHKNIWVYVMYIDNMANNTTVESNIMNTLMISIRKVAPEMPVLRDDIFNALKDGGITSADISETQDFGAITTAILAGDTALLIGQNQTAIILSSKGFPNRGVPTAETEVVIQGSKEAFSEGMRTNTCLIRRRIRDTNLKVKQLQLGRRSKTDIAVMYLKDVVRPQILNDCMDKLFNIEIDGILDSGYVEQLIEDDWLSPFPQCQMTERPDKAASAILEGRIVIIVDNSPFVIIIPTTMNAFFQSSEDYYQRWQIMSFTRLLRYVAGVIAVTLPGIYVAIAVYHPSMIPMSLILKMAGARIGVPLPAVGEVFLMDIAFELLREAGVRLPAALGGTVGIVGGIIIGQAAVEAGLVSPIVVIVIAVTAIASFAIPHVTLVNGFRIVKYFLIILAAVLGLFGLWLGLLIVLIHLVSLKSFGIPYMFPYASGEVNDYSDFKDTLIRMPSFLLKKRPIYANPEQSSRIKEEETGNIHEKE